MSLDRLHQILRETTDLLHIGVEQVTDDVVKVNCQIVQVVVYKEKALQHREELITVLQGLHLRNLEEAASYFDVGAEIGDQGLAFQLFGLGEFLEFWKVVTPGMLDVPAHMCDQIARRGGVTIGQLQMNFL